MKTDEQLGLLRDTAQDGEDCHYCGYPFDVGDRVVMVGDELDSATGPYCSRRCALRHSEILAAGLGTYLECAKIAAEAGA